MLYREHCLLKKKYRERSHLGKYHSISALGQNPDDVRAETHTCARNPRKVLVPHES